MENRQLQKIKQMNDQSYSPIVPDFYDVIDAISGENKNFKVFYFDSKLEIQESKGVFTGLVKSGEGEYLGIENARNVRLDRIITINGKPGPAFDEYDAYANACLSCQAGYDED